MSAESPAGVIHKLTSAVWLIDFCLSGAPKAFPAVFSGNPSRKHILRPGSFGARLLLTAEDGDGACCPGLPLVCLGAMDAWMGGFPTGLAPTDHYRLWIAAALQMEGREQGKGELDREPSGMGQTGNGAESGVCGGGNHFQFHFKGAMSKPQSWKWSCNYLLYNMQSAEGLWDHGLMIHHQGGNK